VSAGLAAGVPVMAKTAPARAPITRVASTELDATSLPQPVLTRDPHTGEARLVEPFVISLALEAAHGPPSPVLVIIPRGFRWDLASVPRAVWWLISPNDLGLVGPLVHDWLYRCGGVVPAPHCEPPRHFSRAAADELLRELMARDGVAGWRRRFAYRAVRLFGGGSWRAPAVAS